MKTEPARRGWRRSHAPIVVNGSPLWPPVTGVQRVARGLVRRLLVEAPAGEVEVLGGPPEFGGGRPAPGGRGGRALWEQAMLPVQARGAEVLLNLGQLAPVLSRNNLVLTYDLHALRHPHHYRAARGRSYWRMVTMAYRRARYRVTLSKSVADELEATLGGRVDAVIPPGVDESFRPVAREAVDGIRSRLGLTGPYVTVVGWAQPAKRAGLAVRAHQLLVADLPHQLVLVGASVPDFTAVELGSPPHSVVMAGRLTDEELAALHTGSSGLLFCSEYEGFGLPPVEALACGSPVAASRITVLEEVLGGLPGVRFVDAEGPEAWAQAAEWLLGQDTGSPRLSRAALDRYPWQGQGRALLRAAGRSP